MRFNQQVPAVVEVAAHAETKPAKPSKKPVAATKPAGAVKKASRTRPTRAKVVATKANPTPNVGVVGTVLGAAAAFISGLKRRLSTA